jgi:Na+/H+ antiporter NhaD/arsenite permease-like protein/mannitol/fructose-specific phosphotransferase system IIA component (Ntr-type)
LAAPNRTDARGPDLVIRPEFIVDLEEARSPEAVFRAAAERLGAAGAVADQAGLVRALLEREAQGSTGVGGEVALPHAILPGPVGEPAVVFVRVRTGVEWHAADGQRVRLVAVIVAGEPARPRYLQTLAAVARKLGNEYLKGRLLRAGSTEKMAQLLHESPTAGWLVRSKNVLLVALAVAAVWAAARLLLPRVVLPGGGIYEQLDLLRFNAEPWLSRQALVVGIFAAMIIGTLLFWKFRLAVVGVGLSVLLLSGVIELPHMVEYMSLPTIIFVMAMMVLIKWVEDKGLFKFIVVQVVRRVGGVPWVLLLILMGFSVLLSGFVGEVSGILVTFGLAVEIARRTKTPVLPYLLALVFATNIGSALTLVGNPIGVYLAFIAQLTFEDFLRWATPVSLASALAIGGLIVLLFRKQLATREPIDRREFERMAGGFDADDLRLGGITFLAVVALIMFHARAEALLHLGEGTMLMAAPLAAVAFIIFVEQERGKQLIARSIDWWTLLFFMFLFASAACLEHTGVTTKLGYLLLQAAEHSPVNHLLGKSGVTGSALVLMLWGSGIGSGFVDNMPIVAALVPVVKSLLAVKLPHASILWWALLFGGCFGGNLTMVGSSANLVAVGMYERVTGQTISFGAWFRTGLIITLVSLVAATAGLLLQVGLAP